MTPERWQVVEALYHAALARAAGEREAYLAKACGADDRLRRDVESRNVSFVGQAVESALASHHAARQ
jgi:hypothetical protein